MSILMVYFPSDAQNQGSRLLEGGSCKVTVEIQFGYFSDA